MKQTFPMFERSAWRWRILLRGRPLYFSTVRCPHCGRRSRDQMPSNASVYFYQCLHCGRVFKPMTKVCCVYCSYGDVPCPDVQRGALGSFLRIGIARATLPGEGKA